MKHFKYILLLLPLLYYSCTDDILQDLDTVAAQNEEQDARLDSLLTIITDQQAYIDSLNNAQHVADSLDNLTLQAYIDSLINAGNVSDSLIQVYTDSLNTVQNTLNADQQAYIDSLINLGNVSDSLLQVYTDSLNTVQNTLNADQQAYIDSLINLGNVSDSLLQVYTDSLNTVQNTYIDSLHNAQQTTLTALANSALSAGFVETQVFSGSIPTSWTDLDLSSVVGSNNSVVLIKYNGSTIISFRPDGATEDWAPGSSTSQTSISIIGENYPQLGLIITGSNGIVEWYTYNSGSGTGTLSVVFYLSQ